MTGGWVADGVVVMREADARKLLGNGYLHLVWLCIALVTLSTNRRDSFQAARDYLFEGKRIQARLMLTQALFGDLRYLRAGQHPRQRRSSLSVNAPHLARFTLLVF